MSKNSSESRKERAEMLRREALKNPSALPPKMETPRGFIHRRMAELAGKAKPAGKKKTSK